MQESWDYGVRMLCIIKCIVTALEEKLKDHLKVISTLGKEQSRKLPSCERLSSHWNGSPTQYGLLSSLCLAQSVLNKYLLNIQTYPNIISKRPSRKILIITTKSKKLIKK